MASTDDIIKAAQDLGKLIATHPSTEKFEKVLSRLREDVDAQRLLNDQNRAVNKLAEKEAQGKPIEVEDKREIEKLSKAIAGNAVLRDLQMAQMDYLDLMRKVDEAISGQSAVQEAARSPNVPPPNLQA